MVPEIMIGQAARHRRSTSDREHGGLGVQRVEHRLDQDQVGAALHQAVGGLVIGGHQLVEADVAEARVVHVRRQGRGAGGGAQHAGHETRPVRGAVFVGHFPRQLGGCEVDLVHQRLHAVVGHGNAVGVEGVGLQDVGACGQVLAVDLPDDGRPGQHQQVVVALHVAGPVGETGAAIIRFLQLVTLDHGAHGPIQDEDAAAGQVEEFAAAVGHGAVLKKWARIVSPAQLRAAKSVRGVGGAANIYIKTIVAYINRLNRMKPKDGDSHECACAIYAPGCAE
jgi:hypothetical protein